MTRTVLSFIFLLTCILGANAQNNYDVSLIPKQLLSHARAVVRSEEATIDIKSMDNINYHVKKAITILNSNAENIAYLYLGYCKTLSIRSVKGVIYNSEGKVISKFNENDLQDVSEYDGYSLFTDWRLKYYSPVISEYPYTIEYEYDERFKESLWFPDWAPNGEKGLSVEKSSFKVICRSGFKIRYKELNQIKKANITTDADGGQTYLWSINNAKAITNEPYQPLDRDLYTAVMIAPDKFAYGDVDGSFTNWQQMGKWIYDKLLLDRDQLPAQTIGHVNELTENISDPKLKAKKIYEYMQQKTHYISVQIGIGGWQPYPAADIDKLNYGDCKGLVNYMHALLKAVNIDSYYCVVNAGRDNKKDMLADFASMQGNHAILCLPFKNDTTWLECTSQDYPFGYLGDFTDDRTVLACTPQGGKLLRTPKYTCQYNLQVRKADLVINNAGELNGDMTTSFSGTIYDARNHEISESYTEQLKDIKKVYTLNNLEIEHLKFDQDKSLNPVTTEQIKFNARDYASVTDNKLYFMVNAVNRNSWLPPKTYNRLYDVHINDGFTDEDDLTYTLPAGYKLDTQPLNITINKPFGNFTAIVQIKGDQLIYKRRLQIIDGVYDKTLYQDIFDMYQDITDADAYTAALIKK